MKHIPALLLCACLAAASMAEPIVVIDGRPQGHGPAPTLERMPPWPPPFVPSPAECAAAAALDASNNLAYVREAAAVDALVSRLGAAAVDDSKPDAYKARLSRAAAIDRHAGALGKLQTDAARKDPAAVAAVAAIAGAAAALAVKAAVDQTRKEMPT